MSQGPWIIDLPWISPPLRDNDRGHWAHKARLTRELREGACFLAIKHNLPRGLSKVRITLHWQPRIRRTRDSLSHAPTLKPLIDGLVDYGLVPDDDLAHVRPGAAIEPLGTIARLWLVIEDLSSEVSA